MSTVQEHLPAGRLRLEGRSLLNTQRRRRLKLMFGAIQPVSAFELQWFRPAGG
jgi:hypothetical protein